MPRKTLQLDEELHKALKMEALKLGVHVQELADRIIYDWLKGHSEKPPEKAGN